MTSLLAVDFLGVRLLRGSQGDGGGGGGGGGVGGGRRRRRRQR